MVYCDLEKTVAFAMKPLSEGRRHETRHHPGRGPAGGVSSSTVSRVLNDSASISQRTRQAVREACQALHYVPDITARGLSGHKTHTIGIIVPDISNPYFSALCTAAEAGASARGYRAILCNTLYEPVNELDAIGRMLSQRVDGLLVAAHSPHTQAQHAALLGELPCVYLGSNHGPGCSYVEVDNEQGAYQATQYLYRLGHRRIVFLGDGRIPGPWSSGCRATGAPCWQTT